jgi:hypothetical protein
MRSASSPKSFAATKVAMRARRKAPMDMEGTRL